MNFEKQLFLCVMAFHPHANGILGHLKLLQNCFQVENYLKIYFSVEMKPEKTEFFSCSIRMYAFIYSFFFSFCLTSDCGPCLCWLHGAISAFVEVAKIMLLLNLLS